MLRHAASEPHFGRHLRQRAHADFAVHYSNLGAGQSYNPSSGLDVSYTAVAVPFTPGGSFTLDDIEVAAFLPTTGDYAQFSIYDTLNSLPDYPGTALESFTFTGPPTNNVSLDGFSGTFTAASVLHPLLNAGEEYWVVMDTVSSNAFWNANTMGALGAATTLADPPGQWSLLPSNSQGALALDGTPTPSAEPGSLPLFGSGLAGLLLFVKRRSARTGRYPGHLLKTVTE